MSYALNNVTTADGYTPQTTLAAHGSSRVTIHARNAAIYYQLGRGVPAAVFDDEVFLPPGTFSGARAFDVVRVRAAVAGVPAQVTVDAG